MAEPSTQLQQLPLQNSAQPTKLKKIRLYANTRLSTYKSCPRKWLFTYVLGWHPDRKSLALIFGSGWHAGQEVIWARAKESLTSPEAVAEAAYEAFCKTWIDAGLPHPDELTPDEIEDFTPRTPMIAKEMFYNYIEARKHIFSDETFEVLAIEKPFAVPLDPHDDTLWYIGIWDKVFKFRGQIVVGEHKTSSAYAKSGGFQRSFLDSFSPNSQIDGYIMAAHLIYGSKVAGVWVDAALVHKQHHDTFKFIPVDRHFTQLDAWLWEQHFWIDNIEGNLAVLKERADANLDYLAAFPKNTNSCSDFGGCTYRDLCSMVANPMKLEGTPLGFKKDFSNPFQNLNLAELGFVVDDAGNVLKES